MNAHKKWRPLPAVSSATMLVCAIYAVIFCSFIHAIVVYNNTSINLSWESDISAPVFCLPYLYPTLLATVYAATGGLVAPTQLGILPGEAAHLPLPSHARRRSEQF